MAPTQKSNKDKIEKVQRRAARFVSSNFRRKACKYLRNVTRSRLACNPLTVVDKINVYPANNGEPFRFRIGSVKSAQLFQLSAENFFRLRYESVPLQWHVNGTDVGTKMKPNRIKNGWNKRFRIGSEISAELCRRDTICSEFRQNCADLFRFSAELCRFIRIFGIIVPIYSDFRQNCADFETILCQIVPNVRLFSLILCTIVPKWHYLFGISA